MHKLYQVIILKEEFKAFVKTKPELISYVSKGDMTWQKFYEIWRLYGEDTKVWDKYKESSNTINNKQNKNSESFSFSSLIDSIKKVDMDSVQKGIGSMQKAIELLQGFTTKGTSGTNANSSSYQPRQLFKKFED